MHPQIEYQVIKENCNTCIPGPGFIEKSLLNETAFRTY